MNHPQRAYGADSPFDAIKRTAADGTEFWSARELMPLLGYEEWRKFEGAIERARAAAENSGAHTPGAFVQVSQLVGAANLGDLRRSDYELSRYACYLVAMNGDPRKRRIAEAQTYFAVRTREAETRPTSAFEIPQTYAQAPHAAADAADRAEAAEARARELEPSAQAWETLASADGDFSVADASKILSRDPAINLGSTRLFTLLREFGWIYRQASDKRWRAYQSAVDCGRVGELPQFHYHQRTGEQVLDAPQLRVTAKGLREILRRLGGAAALPAEEFALVVRDA